MKLEIGQIRALKITRKDGQCVYIFRNTVAQLRLVEQQLSKLGNSIGDAIEYKGPWKVNSMAELKELMIREGPFAPLDEEAQMYVVVTTSKQ